MSAADDKTAAATASSTETKAVPDKPTSIFSASPAFQPSAPAGLKAPASGATAAADGHKDDDDQTAAEEECQAEFAPIVQLEEVETTTGEEAEATLFEMKCKLYRFDNDSNEWKERGIGIVRLLQHKENKKIRLLMRQEKTLKIRANHIVMPGTKLSPHAGNDKAWVWSTVDFADESQKIEMFCIRFGSPEKASDFKKHFEEAMDANAKLLKLEEIPAAADETAKEDQNLASALEGVKVEDKKEDSKE